jgi:hypothetical protein
MYVCMHACIYIYTHTHTHTIYSVQIYECDVTKSRSTYPICLHLWEHVFTLLLARMTCPLACQRCSVLLKSRITPRLSLGLSFSLALSLSRSLSFSLSLCLCLSLSVSLYIYICLFSSLSLCLCLCLMILHFLCEKRVCLVCVWCV